MKGKRELLKFLKGIFKKGVFGKYFGIGKSIDFYYVGVYNVFNKISMR